MHPWEWHPALVHFPIAFLVGGLALDAAALLRRRESWLRPAAGLLVWGVVTGWAAAVAGIVAWFSAPHQPDMHAFLTWHPIVAALSMIVFTGLAAHRWRRRTAFARPSAEGVGALALLLILIAGYLGSHLVYRGGTGVDVVRSARKGP